MSIVSPRHYNAFFDCFGRRIPKRRKLTMCKHQGLVIGAGFFLVILLLIFSTSSTPADNRLSEKTTRDAADISLERLAKKIPAIVSTWANKFTQSDALDAKVRLARRVSPDEAKITLV